MAKDRVLYEGALTGDTRRAIDRNFSDVSLSTAQVDVTSSTALVDITGLTTDALTLAPGTYRFSANLAGTSGASGGYKVAFKLNNGLTLTSIEATGKGFAAAAVVVQHTTTTTDQTSLLASTSAVIKAEIDGTFVVATAGTFQLQFAQNASNGTTSSVYVGSRLEITRVGA